MQDADWYSDDAATFGDRLAGAREAMGLDQEALAHKLGVKLKTLAAWEDDMNEPRANKLQMVSGVLGVSLRWLLTGEGQGVSAPGVGEDVGAMLAKMRQLHAEITHASEQIGVLEKRLRQALSQ